jgi:hypothetical protein
MQRQLTHLFYVVVTKGPSSLWLRDVASRTGEEEAPPTTIKGKGCILTFQPDFYIDLF